MVNSVETTTFMSIDHSGYRKTPSTCSRAYSSLLKLADDVVLPEAPSIDFEYYLEEQYCRSTAGRKHKFYYLVKPMIPRALQLMLRRQYATMQQKTPFPGWPIETLPVLAVEETLRHVIRENGGAPVHRIAPWPDGFSFAAALTHDVEGSDGFRMVEKITACEKEYGYRSTWNVVPEGYRIDWPLMNAIRGEGFELGVHGLRHDGKLFDSYPDFKRQAACLRKYAEEWKAVGFRSPSTLRMAEWMHELGFEYDSSFTDSAPFEPQRGGCCTIWPYFLKETLEIPMTMPQDHTLFVILKHNNIDTWKKKADWIIANGGMIVINTHPDYLLNPKIFSYYREFLGYLGSTRGGWMARMVEINDWWRAREKSRLVRGDSGYVIEGPAAEKGRILVTSHSGNSLMHRYL